MDRVLLSRQPIYAPNMSLFGYELLFRDSDVNRASFTDGGRATADVLVNTFMEIGLDELVGSHHAFINFERNMILQDYCESLPKDRVVLEVLETIEPDDTAVIDKLKRLSANGYRIALDDFVCTDRNYPLLDIADVVKLDILQQNAATLPKTVKTLREFGVDVLAEKVETVEQFEFCKSLGFDYFQGYFFCRPQLVQSTRIPVNRMAAVTLISKLNQPDITLPELETSICCDLSLSYKLLRYVNSAGYGVSKSIDSIRHAAILVGLEKLKMWASLVLFSGLGEKPRDLIITGVVRARMCEELADVLRLPHKSHFFLVGLFSVLDAILDRPIQDVVTSLPLSPEINAALTRFEGALGKVLECVIAYEKQDWANVKYERLSTQTVRHAYVKSLGWALQSFNEMNA